MYKIELEKCKKAFFLIFQKIYPHSAKVYLEKK